MTHLSMSDAFENILGQPQVRDFLRTSVKTERFSQAYIFVGPAGSNKLLAAYALAQALICPKRGQEPRGGQCGQCEGCQKVMRHQHPDVHYCSPEGAQGYLVEQIREIVADTALSPIQATKKIYIIDQADKLGTSGANAFLKTLEEPPEDVVFILLARTRDAVLPTILSRCQIVPFRFIPPAEAAGIVSQNTGVAPDIARIAIESCSGSITRAIEFLRAAGNGRLAFRQEVLRVLAQLPDADSWDIILHTRSLLESIKAPLDEVRALQEAEIAENSDFLAKSALRQIEARNKRALSARSNEFLHQIIAIIASWLRDIMMISANTPELIINSDEKEILERMASRATYARIVRGLEAVNACNTAIAYNVSSETCLNALLFEVKEVFNSAGSSH